METNPEDSGRTDTDAVPESPVLRQPDRTGDSDLAGSTETRSTGSKTTWQPVDYIVAALAAVIVYFVVVLGIGGLLDIPEQPERGKLVGQLIGSIVTLISLYVGAKVRNDNDDT